MTPKIKNQYTLKVPVSDTELLDLGVDGIMASVSTVEDTTSVFDDWRMQFRPVPGYAGEMFAPFGIDNQLPYKIRELIGSDEVTAQNKLFNVLTCYGAGLQLQDSTTKEPTKNAEANKFARRNALSSFYLEQITDMKYYFYAVCIVILSKDGSRINRLVHKDACFCRLQKADRQGRIRHVYYANWQYKSPQKGEVERISLLREHDPIGDLMVKMGKEAGMDGKKFVRTKERKFAILLRFPTVGCQYYPTPYYAAMFRGGSYDEKRLISAAKIAKIRNHASVKYQVEVNRDYWQKLISEERITDPLKQRERIKKEKENIRDFVAGVHNSGKAWITGFYIDPMGHEVRDIRVVNIEGTKEGGDYADDINVAANTLCYADNTHPNLVGAVPGKSQQNNSGSDKRELFTMKQAMETAFHDLLLRPLELVCEFNGWDDIVPTVPMIMLTTLDQHKDAERINPKQQQKL
ncbi:hypothetical protein C7Y71_010010 [Pseudoprevotella muciniphila]|uniref:Phage portal protein n=1 Tax=Pseudoprevotella muciniphila TaxID=2133944 RepID=A0A5P8E8N6_9BACT|nr:hypothetical protein [Pseudoprevotella muciniphila]QFQ13316.1 hypothetical protein C7Y71_010010 [Pseudoprevotella muciniphila]